MKNPVSRQEARTLGLKTYFTGQPCKHGHIAERRVDSCDCTICLAERTKRYSETEAGHANRIARHKRWKAKPGNAEKHREVTRRWREKPEIKEQLKEYTKNRFHSDTNYRLAALLRNKTYAILTGLNNNPSSAFKLLGCTREHAPSHIAARFGPGMSWDNYGQWQIDHIRPLISFDLSDLSQFQTASHYTNLQPLWAFENKSKGGKLH